MYTSPPDPEGQADGDQGEASGHSREGQGSQNVRHHATPVSRADLRERQSPHLPPEERKVRAVPVIRRQRTRSRRAWAASERGCGGNEMENGGRRRTGA